MKILNIVSSVNPSGGGPIEIIKQLSILLNNEKHTCYTLSLDQPNADFLQDYPPDKIFAIGPAISSYYFSPKLISWLLINGKNFDIIIVHGIWQFTSFGTFLSFLLSGFQIPYIIYPHGMLDPWFNRTYPIKHIKKYIYWPLEFLTLHFARFVMYTCQEEMKLAQCSFKPYSCRPIVFNFGISLGNNSLNPEDEHCFFEQYPDLINKQIILFLGRIHSKKGCDILIDSFAQVHHNYPCLHLVIAGPDQQLLANSLVKKSKQLNIEDKITFTGMIKGKAKLSLLKVADVFALSSHQEALPISVVEALSNKLPVLISDKVNIWREIEQDGAGLVSNDDVSGTTEILRKWLNLSIEEKQKMRENAEKCYFSRFNIANVAENLEEIMKT
ncbi:MAG TPA: glycosyltransferase [Stenomitos sp.]